MSGKTSSNRFGSGCIQVYVALAMLLLWTQPLPFYGQSATASITGQITDQTGAVVPAASVIIVDPATNVPRTVTSNAQGYYSLLLLPPANYVLKVTAPGFSQFVQENIRLNVGLDLKVDIALKLGQATESVVVTGAPPAIEPKPPR